MALTMDSLVTQDQMLICTCWKIIRRDGNIIRITDHDRDLFRDGERYSPMGSVTPTAMERSAGMKERNREMVGFIDSEAVSHADLRAGKFREAVVYQYLFKWDGTTSVGATGVLGPPLRTHVYWIDETVFSGEEWNAVLVGLTSWLTREVGHTYSRTCRHKLGDNLCQVDLAPLTVAGTVSSVVTQRRVFESDVAADEDTYTGGKLTWTSGSNVGLSEEVKKQEADGTIEMWLPFPFDIAATDAFSLEPGCDKLKSTCKDTFNNLDNFGGFPFIPGTDKMLETPDATGSGGG